MESARMSDRWGLVASYVFLAMVGAAVLMMLPIVVAVFSDMGFSQQQVVVVGSADMLGLAVGALVASNILSRLPWRQLAIAALTVIVLCNLASAFVAEFAFAVLLRFLAGLGEGVLVSLGNSGLAQTQRPDRNIAIYLVVAPVTAAISLPLLSDVATTAGSQGVFLTLAGFSVLGFLAVLNLPSKNDEEASEPSAGINQKILKNAPAVLASIGVLIYFVGLGAVWGNMQIIGLAAALNSSDVDTALSFALLFAMVGGFGAMLLEARFGRLLPVIMSTMASIAAVLVLTSITINLFYVVTAILMFGWNFAYTYQLAAVGSADESGQFVSICVSMQALGFFAGPSIAGFLMSTEGGIGSLVSLSAACFIASILLVVPVLRSASIREIEAV